MTAFNKSRSHKVSSAPQASRPISPSPQVSAPNTLSSFVPAATLSPQDTIYSATQDDSQYVTQLDEYHNAFEEEEMGQYEDGLIISEDDTEIPAPAVRHAAAWVKGRGVNTQMLEDITRKYAKCLYGRIGTG